MYKNNTVNIQNGTPDTEYIDEFLSSFLFFPPGGCGGPPQALYIVPIYTDTHGFQIGVCVWGLRAGSAPGDPPPRGSLPCRGTWGLGWGVPSMAGKTKPLLGHCPIWRKFWRGGPSPRPPPSPSPCPQSGMVGEVANRFSGQHRGRLGWSSGQWGHQVLPSPPRPHFPGPAPSSAQRTAPFGPADLPASRLSPEAWAALVAATFLCSVMPRAQLQRLELSTQGRVGHSSCLLPLPPGGPLCSPETPA